MTEGIDVRLGQAEVGALIDALAVVTRFQGGALLDSLVELRGREWLVALGSATCAFMEAINRQHVRDGEIYLRLGAMRAELDQLQAETRRAA